MQITIKRFAEQNTSFRSVAASTGQKYNKIQVTHRFRKNNVTRTPEEIEQAARISEQRAIVICAEFLSSLIGTTIGLGLAIWAAYDSHQRKKAEEKEHRDEQKDLSVHFKALEEENKALRLSLANLITKVEKADDIAAAEIDQQAAKQMDLNRLATSNTEAIVILSSKIEEIWMQNKSRNDEMTEIRNQVEVLRNAPKGLDRFKVHVQMPKQAPLDE
jgi:hypothetical protein